MVCFPDPNMTQEFRWSVFAQPLALASSHKQRSRHFPASIPGGIGHGIPGRR
jgi:hypothetical protein